MLVLSDAAYKSLKKKIKVERLNRVWLYIKILYKNLNF